MLKMNAVDRRIDQKSGCCSHYIGKISRRTGTVPPSRMAGANRTGLVRVVRGVRGKFPLRKFLNWIIALVVVYGILVGALFLAMCQLPPVFGRIMSKVPDIAFMVLPFKQLWFIARGGHLNIGDPAPDFLLLTADRKARVQLSSSRGKEPVVLVFGSYT
jgi:hypothetical protein